MRDMISRDEWDDLKPMRVKALVEVGHYALKLVDLKWWQFRERRRIKSLINLVRDCHDLHPINYLP